MHVFPPLELPSVRRPDLHIPEAIEGVVVKMLAKQPGDRFADMRALIDELERVAPLLPEDAPEPSAEVDDRDEETPLPAPRRLGAGMVVAGLTGVFTVGILGWMTLRGRGTSHGGEAGAVHPPAATAASAPANPTSVPGPAIPRPATAATPVTAAAAPKAARASSVEIVLRSVPSGADVYEGENHVGVSPVHLARTASNEAITFVFRRVGFKEGQRDLVPDRDYDIEVVLVPKRTRSGPSGPSAARSPETGPGKHTPTHTTDLRDPFK